MPEGDVVFLAAKRLHRALAGKTLTGCDIRVPRYATVDLSGHRVDEVVPRGKHLLARIGELTIHTHLKMEGVWHVYGADERWRRPAHQARIILRTEDVAAVGFSLGITEVLRRDEEVTAVGHLGPDLLGADWDAAEATRRLCREPHSPIGIALLDQTNLAGIGNIYRSEVCFLSRVHPATPIGAVPELEALTDRAHRVLTQAAHHPPWRAHVYGRYRMPCPRCGANIARENLGDGYGDRSVYYCPRCQPPP
ncbi:Fpg/Nei family DNA glycosylase [Skermania sp. ID1734]|uniref:Fpg/Nei family DNA glycosylase n=1 Tax=Skermania sp. ID1734 TaxID=2597516 RepID=UPI00117D140E|nr:DNA-formamidopyrimidine glycosylase family protein [Skermania sp. ID1734]TSE02018.1 Fpg/Nei family DNA glycosylase [Skermania sp. ID1734]